MLKIALVSHRVKVFTFFMNRAIKLGYYASTDPDLATLQDKIDDKLCNCIMENPCHVLCPLLPAQKQTPYNLRPTGHNLILPQKDDRGYITKMLFKDIY